MKTAKTSGVLTPISDWSELTHGSHLQAQTQHLVNKVVSHCFGYHLLKLGQLSSKLKTNQCPISHQINCAEGGDEIDVKTDLQHLPFQESTIDLCILVHELDFSTDPHQMLREIDRVLTLDGTLIISGYNPYSLFGWRSLLTKKESSSARLFAPSRVIDWLHLLGFEIQQKTHFDYVSTQPQSPIARFVEKIGQRYLPFFCSVYFIVAKKQCAQMTPIKPTFKFRSAIINSTPVSPKQSHSKNIHQDLT